MLRRVFPVGVHRLEASSDLLVVWPTPVRASTGPSRGGGQNSVVAWVLPRKNQSGWEEVHYANELSIYGNSPGPRAQCGTPGVSACARYLCRRDQQGSLGLARLPR